MLLTIDASENDDVDKRKAKRACLLRWQAAELQTKQNWPHFSHTIRNATLAPIKALYRLSKRQATTLKRSFLTMTKRAFLAFLAVVLSASESLAFVNRPAFRSFKPMPAQKTQLSMFLHGLDGAHHDLAILSTPILTSTIAIPSGSLLNTASSAIFDPALESELLADFAHVGLDLSTLLRPATALLRLSIVIGRICAILSDYLPDGHMNPEEIVFQTLMLLFASVACLQSFLPLLLAATAKMTYRDGRAYARMFQSLGITWTQYKAMKSVALDWVQVDPHHYVTEKNDEEYMYWLYSGDVQLRLGKSVQNVTAGSGHIGLLGELRFAKLLDKRNTLAEQTPSPAIQAGGTGATLVRIHVKKLKMLMDQDEELAESIRSLLVKGMHEKLSALMIQEE